MLFRSQARLLRLLIPEEININNKPLMSDVENAVEFTYTNVYESICRVAFLNGLKIFASTLKKPTSAIKLPKNLGNLTFSFT